MRCVRVHDARHAIAFNRASFARLMPSMWAYTEWKNRFRGGIMGARDKDGVRYIEILVF